MNKPMTEYAYIVCRENLVTHNFFFDLTTLAGRQELALSAGRQNDKYDPPFASANPIHHVAHVTLTDRVQTNITTLEVHRASDGTYHLPSQKLDLSISTCICDAPDDEVLAVSEILNRVTDPVAVAEAAEAEDQEVEDMIPLSATEAYEVRAEGVVPPPPPFPGDDEDEENTDTVNSAFDVGIFGDGTDEDEPDEDDYPEPDDTSVEPYLYDEDDYLIVDEVDDDDDDEDDGAELVLREEDEKPEDDPSLEALVRPVERKPPRGRLGPSIRKERAALKNMPISTVRSLALQTWKLSIAEDTPIEDVIQAILEVKWPAVIIPEDDGNDDVPDQETEEVPEPEPEPEPEPSAPVKANTSAGEKSFVLERMGDEQLRDECAVWHVSSEGLDRQEMIDLISAAMEAAHTTSDIPF